MKFIKIRYLPYFRFTFSYSELYNNIDDEFLNYINDRISGGGGINKKVIYTYVIFTNDISPRILKYL